MESEKSLSLTSEGRVSGNGRVKENIRERETENRACEKFERTKVAKNSYSRGRELRFLVKDESKSVRVLE